MGTKHGVGQETRLGEAIFGRSARGSTPHAGAHSNAAVVLAAQALADHPLILLPIIVYNLVQQSVAGIVDRLLRRGRGATRGTRPHEDESSDRPQAR